MQAQARFHKFRHLDNNAQHLLKVKGKDFRNDVFYLLQQCQLFATRREKQ